MRRCSHCAGTAHTVVQFPLALCDWSALLLLLHFSEWNILAVKKNEEIFTVRFFYLFLFLKHGNPIYYIPPNYQALWNCQTFYSVTCRAFVVSVTTSMRHCCKWLCIQSPCLVAISVHFENCLRTVLHSHWNISSWSVSVQVPSHHASAFFIFCVSLTVFCHCCLEPQNTNTEEKSSHCCTCIIS